VARGPRGGPCLSVAPGSAGPPLAGERYDAVLLVSFGGPEGPDDVLPFLRNVTAGRGVPDERLAEVAHHYDRFGGVSPINAQNRELLAALRDVLAPRRVYWGNRNWAPYLDEALAEMRADGVRRAAVFVTSGYASYSSCRQYRENLAAALTGVGPWDLQLDKLRNSYNHPGFIAAQTGRVLELAFADDARMVFTAHSIPLASAASSGPDGGAYAHQLEQAAGLVAAEVARRSPWRGTYEIAWQSRSGPPSVPWLEPDVNDVLRRLAGARVREVVLVPVGFVSDHVEVRYDLDVEARATADEVGIRLHRAGTVGTAPDFVGMVRDLVLEREAGTVGAERPALGGDGPSYDVCPLTCCPGRSPQPAAAGEPADLRRGATGSEGEPTRSSG
jgi:protoporphyrin/coproporphyrin ferrochelatase